MKIEDLTKDEKSLLLYFETREVDFNCLVEEQKMSKTDFKIAKRWHREGIIAFKAMPVNIILNGIPKSLGTHYVLLTEELRAIAHQLRNARALKGQDYLLTEILSKYTSNQDLKNSE